MHGVEPVPTKAGLLGEGHRRINKRLHHDHGRDHPDVVRPDRAALFSKIVTPDCPPSHRLVVNLRLDVRRGPVVADLISDSFDLLLRQAFQVVVLADLVAVSFVESGLRTHSGVPGELVLPLRPAT